MDFNYWTTDWQMRPEEQHPFIEDIRKAILKYRLQSASHFNCSINVAQAKHPNNPHKLTDLTPSFVLQVGFYNFGSGPVFVACQPKYRKCSRKNACVLTNDIEVLHNNEATLLYVSPLHVFLGTEFPIFDMVAGPKVMYQWWSKNGKTFDWAGLPTELKEQIVQSCMREASGESDAVLGYRRKRFRDDRGATEIVRKFGTWASLLGVSRQVRTLALRLCFVGSSGSIGNAALCLDAFTYHTFENGIRRLGKFYQMTEAYAVPMDAKSQALARTYKQHPKIYPQLKQYATLSQGIRRIWIQMDFLQYLKFFKVTARGFQQYWRTRGLDYEVFEQLPYLNELIIELPDPRARLRDRTRQSEPRLFYDEPFSCPRTLHRLIYERAAEVLAPYNVTMVGFMDELEAVYFETLRNNAIKALKFTSAELEELYLEDGGGVQLEDSVIPGVKVEDEGAAEGQVEDVQCTAFSRREGKRKRTDAKVQDDFWPPKCRCEVLCDKALYPDTIFM
jgi:hypothetical protein